MDELQQQQLCQSSSFLVGSAYPLSPQLSDAGMLQDDSFGSLDDYAFADGASDESFNPPLNFTFDDFINETATSAVDA